MRFNGTLLLLQDLCARLPYGVKVNHLLDIKPSDLFAIDTYRSTLYCFRNGMEEWYKYFVNYLQFDKQIIGDFRKAMEE